MATDPAQTFAERRRRVERLIDAAQVIGLLAPSHTPDRASSLEAGAAHRRSKPLR